MAFLEIRDLTYTYPNTGVRALDGLNLDADRGELIAVIGSNAAGKSTFALLLKGLLQPDSGKVRINGKEQVTSGTNPGVGILFSNPENQLVTSIVEEDVAFGLEVLGEPSEEIAKKVEKMLERLKVTHLRKRMPHLMSGGEQQMTALAGVLVLDPDILILDEPTTYLDPYARVSVLGFMRKLVDQGKIIILITHDMKEAANADRVILFESGRAARHGPPEDVFSKPGLGDRYGIFPPFFLSLVLEMRSAGIEVKWPCSPGSLARTVVNGMNVRKGFSSKDTGHHAAIHRGEPVLTFDGVGFSYEKDAPGVKGVLNGVNFAVDKGTVALICGANGSGKSTLLQMSNGLVTPDDGKIILGGRQLKNWGKKRGGVTARVGLLFQNPERQLFSATVADDIAFGPRNLGVSARQIEGRVLKAAKWVGLPETLLTRPVYTLSGGQMRRAAVAGVLAMEPEILVLDEPTDGLDPGGVREFIASTRRYCDETGTAVLIATHAVPEQIHCIDHFGHLAGGMIQSSGPPSGVLTGPERTLPTQFLPDHLVLREELLEMGVALPDTILDPVVARKKLLALAKGEE
ncbi:MAG: energy-coupling factor transporter ATPase [bacterium]|nr:energy-coupling factor transporter ATPase [bacterium]MDT8364940.1 energy-coupling factor transporter ATPase [bacterium]